MPRYEFFCTSCQHTFERQLTIDERNTPQVCPACGRDTVARVISAPGFTVHGFNAKNHYGCAPTG